MSIVEQALKLAQQSKPKPSTPSARASAPAVGTDAPGAVAASGERVVPTTSALDQNLTLPSIVLDVEDLRRQGRMAPPDAARRLNDEMRRVKWPLLRMLRAEADNVPAVHNVVQITSAQPGEGKTFTALALALNIVLDKELRVVLIDGDVARPGLTTALNMMDRPGLTDALLDSSLDLDTITCRTDVEGLYVVPSGRPHERSSELLASDRMQQILSSFASRVGNGVVLVDSPPLLATNEAQVLTRHVGHVLLVVRADYSEHRMVQDAIALIEDHVKVSAVLNAIRPTMLGRYYGEYRYDYGYAEGARATIKPRGASQ